MKTGDRIWFVAVAVFLVFSFTSCRTHTEYIPMQTTVTSASTDSLEHYMRQLLMMQRSVRERESVSTSTSIRETVVLNENGDTTRHVTHVLEETDRSRELEIENNILRAELDSLRTVKAKVDSVDRPVPYPVEITKEVAKPLTWWQKSLMWTGGLSLLILVIMFVAFVKKRIR